MKKILITGSEGMLGRALMQAARAKGLHAIGADILSNENNMDITNLDSVTSIIKDIRPDAIIHTAAYTDVDGCELNSDKAYLINAEGTENVAIACKDTGAFLIYISTDFIFDGNKTSPYDEDDTPAPVNIYGRSKLQGEERVKKLLEQYLIIRTSWLFGKGGKNFVDTIIHKAESGEPLKVVDDQRGSPTYSVDLAGTITNFLALNTERLSSTLNITNSGNCTWYEFAKETIRVKDIKDVEIEPIASDNVKRAANRPKMSILDNANFIKAFGNPLPSWQDALTRYLKT